MEESFTVTLNSSGDKACQTEPEGLALIDIFTFVTGQPVTARLLWIALTSKKSKDILNCNLALFHNSLYFMCFVHLFLLFLNPQKASQLLQILLISAQIGGPMSLSFICVERYFAVIHPTSYPLLKKYRCREVCAGAVWLLSLVVVLVTYHLMEDVSPPAETVIKTIPVIVMVLMNSLMVWCSFCIARTIKRSGPGRDELHPVKRKAFRTVCATSFINLLFYIPVTMMQRLKFVDENSFRCRIISLCVLLLSVASVVHPLFYLSTQRRPLSCSKRQKRPT